MKNLPSFAAIVFLLSIIPISQAQQTQQQQIDVPSPTPYAIVSRDANSRVWESISYDLLPSGQTVPHLHSYTELATGLCYRQNGQWMDSQEQINILADGSGAATNGQHQAYFPADIYNGVIRLVTPDGLQLQSQPFGLSYDDGTNTTIIAELTNSVGQLVSPNQILYPNAFAGIDADLLYTYRKSGFEQDVIFRKQVPTPEQFGLSSVNTRLQLLTAFFNPPTPVETSGPLNPQDGLQDTSLTFGAMKMINGHAFLANATGVQNSLSQPPVYKSWIVVDGQQLLIEQLPYQSISSQLATLPQMSASALKMLNSISHKLSLKNALSRRRAFAMSDKPIQLARADSIQKPGVVFDYVTINSTETNFTFQGDTTYFISSPCNFFGTTTIEGGAIVKMTNYIGGGNMINIDQNGTVDCLTAPYRPAVFTSSDDNTLGETFPGSTGLPGIEENIFDLCINSNSLSIHDCRFNYAYLAINQGYYPATINITNCQFENTEVAVAASTIGLYNVLMGVTTNSVHAQILSDQLPQVYMEGTNLIAENVTADSGYAFVDASTSGETLALTNCLVTSETVTDQDNPSIILTNGVVYLPTPSTPVYQVVGGGNYYLTNGSTYRDYGTTNIDPGLLAYLSRRTTWPPVVYDATNISSLGTLNIAAFRDTNSSPDIGYHYDPLDYAFGGCDLYSNLTIATGTAIGWFEDNGSQYGSIGNSYGMSLNNGAYLSFIGNATQPCFLSQFRRVQEGGNTNWSNVGYNFGLIFNGNNIGQEPQISANFMTATATYGVNTMQDRLAYGSGSFKNCEFYDSGITTYKEQSLDFTNCLFFRTPIAFWDTGYNLSFVFENCTFYDGGLALVRSGSSFWQIQNSSFDGTAIWWSDVYNGSGTYTLFDYNAYNTNNVGWQTYSMGVPTTNKLEVVGMTDLMVTNYNWETSWFGNFYLPANSPLITNGSASASLLGLYHFTTQTNQTPEGTNNVDIGYHYVAIDTNGIPLDSNGDGIPDYLEDANGDGLVDNGETNWALAILIQPTNQTIMQYSNTSFRVTAGGIPTLIYQWYSNSIAIANATNATLTLNNVQTNGAGTYYVIVTNNFGAVTSSIVTLSVLAPPVISITNPADGHIFIANPTNITLMAAASDFAGTVTQVQFFVGSTNLGFATVAPYNLVWSNVLIGNYYLTAVATDNYGLSSTSAFVNIGVVLQPTVSDNSFEAPVATTGTEIITPGGTPWVYTGNSGIANGTVSPWLTVTTPAGNQAAFLNNTATISQTVWFTNGVYSNSAYTISFIASTDGTDSSNSFNVTVDGTIVGSFDPPTAGYSNYVTGPFIVPQGNHVIAFVGTGSQTAMIDYVNINDVPLSSVIPSFLDFSFESPVAGYGSQSGDPVGTPWAYTANSGVVDNHRGGWMTVQTPDGNQAAYLNANATISQAVTFPIDRYAISFIASEDGSGDGPCPFNLQVDGQTVTNFDPNAIGYSNYLTVSFLIFSNGFHTVSFVGSGSGAQTAMIDKLGINVVTGPVVSISSPNNNAIFTVGSNITLSAAVSESGSGTITNVQFFTGASSLGIATGPLYNLTWSGAAVGSYALTAVAADNLGNVATSSVVNVTVTPIAVGTSLYLWLKADSITNLMNGSPVSIWPDISGLGYNGTQTTFADEPTYYTNGLNGFPVVQFDGTNDYLNLPDILNGTTQAEEFVVLRAKTSQPSANQDLWLMGSDASDGSLLGYPNTSGEIVEDFGSDSTYDLGVPSQSLTQYNVYDVAGQNGDWDAWLNGVLLEEVPGNNYNYLNEAQVLGKSGLGFNWAGDIAEILVFNRALSMVERQSVTGYLNSKYGIITGVTLFSPSNNIVLAAPANVTLSASASGIDPIQVEFYDSASSLGVVYTPSFGVFSETWSGVGVGVYSLTARATDDSGLIFTSSVVNVVVDIPPTVTLTNPANNTIFRAGSNIVLGASASDADGTVTQVQFFQGSPA